MEMYSSDPDLSSRKLSTATVVPSDFESSSSNYFDEVHTTNSSNSDGNMLPSAPLSSNLVKLYLAKTAIDESESVDEVQDTAESDKSTSPFNTLLGMQFNQILWARRQQQLIGQQEQQKQNKYDFCDRLVWTDLSCYSSSASENELWPTNDNHEKGSNEQWNSNFNYLSDDGGSKVTKRKISNSQLSRLRNSKPQVPIPNIIRSHSGINISRTDRLYGLQNNPHNGLLNIQTTTDYLDMSTTFRNKFHHSNSNLNGTYKYDQLVSHTSNQSTPDLSGTIANKPFIRSANISPHHSSRRLLKQSLRDLWDDFKSKSSIVNNTDNGDKYIYLDDKSLERRINGQTSNLILPVSF